MKVERKWQRDNDMIKYGGEGGTEVDEKLIHWRSDEARAEPHEIRGGHLPISD
jgi:hypothetical protein